MVQVAANQLQGLPVRLTLVKASQEMCSPAIKLHGTIREAEGDRLIVDLATAFPASMRSGVLEAEVLHPAGLVRFEISNGVEQIHAQMIAMRAPATGEIVCIQRRKHLRCSVNLTCRVTPYRAGAKGERFRGVSLNLSTGGVAVAGQTGLAAGDRAYLEFPEESALSWAMILAEVVRVGVDDTGTALVAFRFIDLGSAEMVAITRFVQRQSQIELERNRILNSLNMD